MAHRGGRTTLLEEQDLGLVIMRMAAVDFCHLSGPCQMDTGGLVG